MLRAFRPQPIQLGSCECDGQFFDLIYLQDLLPGKLPFSGSKTSYPL